MTTSRAADPDDADRIRAVAESSMTASYSLSPRELDAVVEDQFSPERQQEWTDDEDTVFLVTESDGTVVAVTKAAVDGEQGDVRWLFVDPEHRGQGHATELLESILDELDERGATEVRALALTENQEGEAFFERFDFQQVDEQDVEFGGQELTEHVYSRDAEEGEPREREEPSDEPSEFPEDGRATTDDGTEVRVDRDEERSGTKAPFFATYVGDDGEQHGFFCSNCGATDTAMNGMERLECQSCGNQHKPDGSEQYDDGYL
ncbi:GNAT family N-acetyltransferase [Halomarina salina]|uniref:GNAT family N-acetyltransferase n=1 Tax=Halomarina salina TaxID=1872699 RepID=A0ABD5RP76_9EURY